MAAVHGQKMLSLVVVVADIGIAVIVEAIGHLGDVVVCTVNNGNTCRQGTCDGRKNLTFAGI
jgi:hypothetical protein